MQVKPILVREKVKYILYIQAEVFLKRNTFYLFYEGVISLGKKYPFLLVQVIKVCCPKQDFSAGRTCMYVENLPVIITTFLQPYKCQQWPNCVIALTSSPESILLGKIESKRRGRQMMRWLDGITDSMDMNLG